jgi:putative heme transporter
VAVPRVNGGPVRPHTHGRPVPIGRPRTAGLSERGSRAGSASGSGSGEPSRSAGALAGARVVAREREATEVAQARRVGEGLRITADYSWRLLIVGAAFYVAFMVLLRFELVGIAIFLALVLTSLLRPSVTAMSRRLPHSLAVLFTMFGSLLVIAALLTLVGTAVAGESSRLGTEFSGGIDRIEQWLQGPPFKIKHSTVSGLQGKITSFISAHRSTLISHALSGAGQAVEVLTVLALAVFCSIFFVHSGEHMWRWFAVQLPEGARSSWDRAGRAAWSTFSGYTRGVIIVAGTNAILVGIALYVLRVPLALPLTVLEFLASFIPLVGSPMALAVATVVALAARGPVTAGIVLVLIVVIGQIEGHIMQPLVMGWAVRLHPVVVAVSVIASTVVAGIMGAVVAVPMVSIAWAVYRELRTEPLQVK